MAIGTDAGIGFFGTQDTVISTGSTIADGGLSVSGDVTSWTNDDDAEEAVAVFTGTYSSAPDAHSSVALFARPMNIDGTNDQQTPDANFQEAYVGSFPLNDNTSQQPVQIMIGLPNGYSSQTYEFFIQNNGGQTLSSGATVKITPKAIGPHG